MQEGKLLRTGGLCWPVSWARIQVADPKDMSAKFQFAAAAEAEYFDAIRYYAAAASDAEVAVRFVAAIEDAVATICAAPGM